MDTWIEAVPDAEDMRRRCAAHEAWMAANPLVASAALAFGAANQPAIPVTPSDLVRWRRAG